MQQALVTRLIESKPWLIAALPAPCPLTEEAHAFEQGLYHTLWAMWLKRHRASARSPGQPLLHTDLLCGSVSPLRTKANTSTLFAWRSTGEDHCTRISLQDCYTPVRHPAHTIIASKLKEMTAAPSLSKQGKKKAVLGAILAGKPSKLMEGVSGPGGLEVPSQSTCLIPSVFQTRNPRKRK